MQAIQLEVSRLMIKESSFVNKSVCELIEGIHSQHKRAKLKVGENIVQLYRKPVIIGQGHCVWYWLNT